MGKAEHEIARRPPLASLVLVLSAALGLTACPLDSQGSTSDRGEGQAIVPGIAGSVRFGPGDYGLRADIPSVALAATVSLIDTSTNQTVATALTDKDRNFVFNFGSSFVPTTAVYILEAVKGLNDNRAGASVVRIRTLIRWVAGSWVSVTRGAFIINRATTALTIIASLKGIPPETFLERVTPGEPGSGNPGTFDDGGTGVSQEDYLAVIALIDDALAQDRDPVESIYFAGGKYAMKSGSGSVRPFIVDVVPNPVVTGGLMRISGTNFPDYGLANLVKINEATATVTDFSSGSITALVPRDAVSGLLRVLNPLGEGTYSLQVTPTLSGDLDPKGLYASADPNATPNPNLIGGFSAGGNYVMGYANPANTPGPRATGPVPNLVGDFNTKSDSSFYTGPTPPPPPILSGEFTPRATPTP